MSLLKANSVQIGQSSTATNNFTLSVPSSPDGTIKLARGNSGATTADVLTVDASGAITGATITSSTINGGAITSETAQASTSVTAIDFTGIPSWVKKITVMLGGVSLSSTSSILVQIGISSGIETSGYLGASTAHASGSGYSNYGSGFGVFSNQSASTISGLMTISLLGSNRWIAGGSFGYENTAASVITGGQKALSGTLDRVRVTTTGADTFDAGNINILYEG